jgi:hypothetical protein
MEWQIKGLLWNFERVAMKIEIKREKKKKIEFENCGILDEVFLI